MNKKSEIEKLKKELKDLNDMIPGKCFQKYKQSSITAEHLQKIEELEDKISQLKKSD